MTCPDWVRDLNLWSDKTMHQDPYARYAELRRQCPVAWSEQNGGHWFVTRYADIVRILQDPETFSSITQTVPPFEDPLGTRIPGEVDGAEHTSYRRAVLGPFSPGGLAPLEPAARAAMAKLLDQVEPPEFEFVRGVAIPYVFDCAMHLFGIEPQDHALVRELESGGLRKDPHNRGLTEQLAAFIEGLVTARRENPREQPQDVLDHLAIAQWNGQRLLTLDETVRLAVFLLKAGLHTTMNALGNCMVFLSEHLDVRDLLVARPELTGEVLEELMRWESILVVTRTATRDVEVAGVKMRAGDRMMLLTGSAGRDDSEFDDPDSVDFGRANVRHLMFGTGPHHCMGRHLARLELRVALEEIHKRIPTYRADPDRPARRYTAMSRGARELHLLIDHNIASR